MSKVHTVKQGECLSTIAWSHGFSDWRTIYEHPDNEEFRRLRPNPHLLYPGDQIHIPPLKAKTVSAKAGATHVFTLKRSPRRLRVGVRDHDGTVLANTDYVLIVRGREKSGKTNQDGLLDEEIGDATRCKLVIRGRTMELAVGELNPMEHTDDGGISGAQMRLRNLGFNPGPVDGKMGPRTAAALSAFQRVQGLEVTGELDSATRQKLTERFGC
ncbi:peptidoglycan-binding protein [Archangium violaceum]|uniref:PGRP and LysM peptidoglycan-binding domain-containing protein n=1 Tax=Archangium violaceum TaxID=83451 RepID=UPI00193B22F3|nr:peptidoglycan-binding protein [Archangium violaceum]QRK05469.1 peptidoglycan-binding protein [Archangium violaceum]